MSREFPRIGDRVIYQERAYAIDRINYDHNPVDYDLIDDEINVEEIIYHIALNEFLFVDEIEVKNMKPLPKYYPGDIVQNTLNDKFMVITSPGEWSDDTSSYKYEFGGELFDEEHLRGISIDSGNMELMNCIAQSFMARMIQQAEDSGVDKRIAMGIEAVWYPGSYECEIANTVTIDYGNGVKSHSLVDALRIAVDQHNERKAVAPISITYRPKHG